MRPYNDPKWLHEELPASTVLDYNDCIRLTNCPASGFEFHNLETRPRQLISIGSISFRLSAYVCQREMVTSFPKLRIVRLTILPDEETSLARHLPRATVIRSFDHKFVRGKIERLTI